MLRVLLQNAFGNFTVALFVLSEQHMREQRVSWKLMAMADG